MQRVSLKERAVIARVPVPLAPKVKLHVDRVTALVLRAVCAPDTVTHRVFAGVRTVTTTGALGRAYSVVPTSAVPVPPATAAAVASTATGFTPQMACNGTWRDNQPDTHWFSVHLGAGGGGDRPASVTKRVNLSAQGPPGLTQPRACNRAASTGWPCRFGSWVCIDASIPYAPPLSWSAQRYAIQP